jgi:hypothetical protein
VVDDVVVEWNQAEGRIDGNVELLSSPPNCPPQGELGIVVDFEIAAPLCSNEIRATHYFVTNQSGPISGIIDPVPPPPLASENDWPLGYYVVSYRGIEGSTSRTISLDVDIYMPQGQVYTVRDIKYTAYTFSNQQVPSNPAAYTWPQEYYYVLRNENGVELYRSPTCTYTPTNPYPMNFGPTCSVSQAPSQPISGVYKVTISQRVTQPVPGCFAGNSNYCYFVAFDNIVILTTTSSPANPTPTPTKPPRLVAAEAVSFHQYSAQFGLPLPFDIMPVADFGGITSSQGYGPTGFAFYALPPPYRRTHDIHTGIDFTNLVQGKAVIAVCDGVVVGGRTTGQYTGYGLSIRCFADDPADTDSDGYRNLSNIVVTYNHLDNQTRSDLPGSLGVVYKGQVIGYTAAYYFGANVQYCLNTDSPPPDVQDCRVADPFSSVIIQGVSYTVGLNCIDQYAEANGGTFECRSASVTLPQDYRWCRFSGRDAIADDCRIPMSDTYPGVVSGRGEGLTCIDTQGVNEYIDPQSQSVDHLHLEMFLARGYKDSNGINHLNAVRLNPLLMFTGLQVNQFTSSTLLMPYFPVIDRNGTLAPNTLGLAVGDLNAFSPRANLPDNEPFRNGFFQIQTPVPASTPEWWLSTIPVPQGFEGVGRMVPDIVAFLLAHGYSPTLTYIGPNCTNISATAAIRPLVQGNPNLACTMVNDDSNGNNFPPVVP